MTTTTDRATVLRAEIEGAFALSADAIGHDGGCACSAGCYDLSVLNGVDNVITNVEFDYRPAGDGEYPMKDGKTHPDDPDEEWTGFYRVFVYAENQKVNLMQFDGSDGNGYYGTGFGLLVRDITPEAKS